MKLYFEYQAMERNGDILAEFNTPNCTLIRNSYSTDKYKMCKDDIVTPLFCSASDCLSKSMIMGSERKSAESYLKSSGNKMNLFSAMRSYVNSDEYNMPIIESSVDSVQDMCDSPTWDKPPPMLQSFSPQKFENFSPQNSFLNGSKLQITNSNINNENKLLKTRDSYNCKINDSNIIDNKLLLDYEAETSSSSIEEVYCSSDEKHKQSDSKNILIETLDVDSNHNIKTAVDQNVTKNPSLPPSPPSKLVELKIKEEPNSPPSKNDRVMPELIPTLICLDDDSVPPESKKDPCEVIDVADSPEMPTLIPFTSEVDEAFRIKTECVSEDEKTKSDDSNSPESLGEMQQPHVLLQRLLVNNCNISKEKSKKKVSSAATENGRKSFNEGPEIEEIEGVRFFQFRSKKEMEEFNSKSTKTEADEDMIVPTKTTDITQIKGWRTKFFAPESEFQLPAFDFDYIKTDELSQGCKISANHVDEVQNQNNDKKEHYSDSPKSQSKNSVSSSKCEGEESGQDDDKCDDSSSESGEEEKRTRFKPVKNEDNKNSLSAFISEELDKYLLNSATLNVSLLQQVNPNIKPISPDAPILSIGKLRKLDKPSPLPIIIFKRKRELLSSAKVESDQNDPIEIIDDSPVSPKVITLESSEESGKDDIPLARLKPKRKILVKKGSSRGMKRNLDHDLEQAAKRVVLRLTKEGNGYSKGYKVSDISCKKNQSNCSSRASSPSSSSVSSLDLSQDAIEMPPDGSLPIIKQTLFSGKNEPKLVDEFLNNLNMYGTRKGVAMLVQSNQSYFDEGPTLSVKICAKAMSVLFSNKEYLEEKQKTKKKKMKTWQKYLPKKFDKEKMKMKFTKRKSRIQRLLDDAESIIPAERGKRSIRLPARYLDSAVLAASEWVSPVITIDDTPAKSKRQVASEVSDKNKLNDENKTVSSSSSSSSSSSESSSDSSDEDTCNKIVLQAPQKRPLSAKEIPTKKVKVNESQCKISPKTGPKKSFKTNQKNVASVYKNAQVTHNTKMTDTLSSDTSEEDTIDKPFINEITKNKYGIENNMTMDKAIKDILSTPPAKESSFKNTINTNVSNSTFKNTINTNVSNSTDKNIINTNVSNSTDKNIINTTVSDSTEVSREDNTIYVEKKKEISTAQKYPFPECFCKHSSRTTLFDYISKTFTCKFCTDMKKHLFQPASVKKAGMQQIKADPDSSKNEEENISGVSAKNSEELSSRSEASIPESVKHDTVSSTGSIKCNTLSGETCESSLQDSDGPLPIVVSTSSISSVSDHLQKVEQKLQSEHMNSTSSVSPNPVNNKYFLVLKPASQNTNNVNNSSTSLQQELKSRTPVINKKSKPPILIRKTPTGFVNQSVPNEPFSHSSYLENNSQPYQKTSLPTSHNSVSPASDRLLKLAENTFPRLTSSLAGLASVNKDNAAKIVNSIQKPVPHVKPQIVAYKVGGNIWFYNSVVPSSEANVENKDNVPPSPPRPTIVRAQQDSGMPVIASVCSVQPNPPVKQLTEMTPSLQADDDTSCKETTKSTSNSEPVPQNSDIALTDHSNYHKKRQNRRKSPLAPLNYGGGDDNDPLLDNDDEDVEVDIETVDDTCNVFGLLKKNVESDSEISDNECADIFTSSTNHLAVAYSTKSLKERRRRYLIKNGFENLKATSKFFKNANSCIEILRMAQTVITAHQKKDKMFSLAKKRLKVHNALLMGKLMRVLGSIESPNIRNVRKMQVIRALSVENFKPKKPLLPLLTEGNKESTLKKSKTQRKKSNPGSSENEAVKIGKDLSSLEENSQPAIQENVKEKIKTVHSVKRNKKNKKDLSQNLNPFFSPQVSSDSAQSVSAFSTERSTAKQIMQPSLDLSILYDEHSNEKVSSSVNQTSKPFENACSRNFAKLSQSSSDNVSSKQAINTEEDVEESSIHSSWKPSGTPVIKNVFCNKPSSSQECSNDSVLSVKAASTNENVEEPIVNSSSLPSVKPVIQNVFFNKLSSSQECSNDSVLSVQTDTSKEVRNPVTIPPAIESMETGDTNLDSAKNETIKEDVRDSLKGKQKLLIEDMKQKVKDSLEKAKKEDSSDSDTEELEDFDLEDSTPLKHDQAFSNKLNVNSSSESSSNMEVTVIEKSPSKSTNEYPGLIPLFHPKVLMENFNYPHLNLLASSSKESSQKKNEKEPKTTTAANDDDDEIAIISSTVTTPRTGNLSSSSKTEIELAKAAAAANRLFGPCRVQKVQLKNGETKFVYFPETTASTSTCSSTKSDSSGNSALHINTAVSRSSVSNKDNQNKSGIPEEIVLSDSEDETDSKGDNARRTLHSSPYSTNFNSGARNEKTDDKPMEIDESNSQNELQRIDS